MFEVRNNAGQVLYRNESFSKCKPYAERAAKNLGEPFHIFEVKQLWSTQTLDQAIDDGSYTDDPRLATPMSWG